MSETSKNKASTDDTDHAGHCVLCTPAAHANRDEHAQIPMELEVDGDILGADVRVCDQHYRVIERVVKIENDRYTHPSTDQNEGEL